MIFIINYRDNTSTTASGDTWSEVVAYAEGTGKEILTITNSYSSELVLKQSGSSVCYQITMKDNTTNYTFNYQIFETNFESINSWILEQTNKGVLTINKSVRNYVSL